MKNFHLYLVFILFIPFLIFSCGNYEDAIDPYTTGEWKTFTTRDGIGGAEIWTMLSDSKGNLWIGTLDNGVSQYNGKDWIIWNTSDGLIDNGVLAIEEDVNGDLWFGTFNGFSIFNGSEFQNYLGTDGNTWQVRALKQAKNGSMWIGTWGYGFFEITSDYLYTYYNDNWEESNYINCMSEDNHGNLWVGTDVGAYKVSFNDVDFYSDQNGLMDATVKAVLCDSWGHIWFGHDDDEFLTRFDGSKFFPVSLYNGIDQNYITSFMEDKSGNIWIGMISNGVAKYDGTIMRSFFEADGLASNTIMSVVQDKNGNIWFGSYENGITRYIPTMND